MGFVFRSILSFTATPLHQGQKRRRDLLHCAQYCPTSAASSHCHPRMSQLQLSWRPGSGGENADIQWNSTGRHDRRHGHNDPAKIDVCQERAPCDQKTTRKLHMILQQGLDETRRIFSSTKMMRTLKQADGQAPRELCHCPHHWQHPGMYIDSV